MLADANLDCAIGLERDFLFHVAHKGTQEPRDGGPVGIRERGRSKSHAEQVERPREEALPTLDKIDPFAVEGDVGLCCQEFLEPARLNAPELVGVERN